MSDQRPLSYRAAGVDIDAGMRLVERIKPYVARTHRKGVLGGLGGFGGLFELPAGYRRPVLVSATDGVGTKLKLALQQRCLGGIGIDLVAMCANDVVVTGAEPLFFLDYYASGRLDIEAASEVIAGIARGCELAAVALIGGETAEMPGVYSGPDFDLAGFCVGVVEKQRLIDGSRVAPGDALLGLAASGPHSNGYSLIRSIVEREPVNAPQQALLQPTRIYVRSLLRLFESVEVRALAHITGGGLPENLPRVLPENTLAVVDSAAWPRPEVFRWLQERGRIDDTEMWRTFNCGVGMVVCVAPDDVAASLASLSDSGETVWRIGTVEACLGESRVVFRS